MSSRHEWSDDVAPYLLGALSPDEAARFEGHLVSCTVCQAELDDLRPVIEALPQTVEEVEPPASLKRAVMAEVEREAAVRAELANAGSPAARSAARGRAPLWRRPLPALALACVLVVVGIGVGVVVTGQETDTYAGTCAPGCSAELEVRGGNGTLHVARMEDAPTGRVYQVWLMREGSDTPEPTDALFNPSSGGTATVDVPGDLDDVVRVLVSEEPRGGSQAPTTAPGIDVPLARS